MNPPIMADIQECLRLSQLYKLPMVILVHETKDALTALLSSPCFHTGAPSSPSQFVTATVGVAPVVARPGAPDATLPSVSFGQTLATSAVVHCVTKDDTAAFASLSQVVTIASVPVAFVFPLGAASGPRTSLAIPLVDPSVAPKDAGTPVASGGSSPTAAAGTTSPTRRRDMNRPALPPNAVASRLFHSAGQAFLAMQHYEQVAAQRAAQMFAGGVEAESQMPARDFASTTSMRYRLSVAPSTLLGSTHNSRVPTRLNFGGADAAGASSSVPPPSSLSDFMSALVMMNDTMWVSNEEIDRGIAKVMGSIPVLTKACPPTTTSAATVSTASAATAAVVKPTVAPAQSVPVKTAAPVPTPTVVAAPPTATPASPPRPQSATAPKVGPLVIRVEVTGIETSHNITLTRTERASERLFPCLYQSIMAGGIVTPPALSATTASAAAAAPSPGLKAVTATMILPGIVTGGVSQHKPIRFTDHGNMTLQELFQEPPSQDQPGSGVVLILRVDSRGCQQVKSAVASTQQAKYQSVVAQARVLDGEASAAAAAAKVSTPTHADPAPLPPITSTKVAGGPSSVRLRLQYPPGAPNAAGGTFAVVEVDPATTTVRRVCELTLIRAGFFPDPTTAGGDDDDSHGPTGKKAASSEQVASYDVIVGGTRCEIEVQGSTPIADLGFKSGNVAVRLDTARWVVAQRQQQHAADMKRDAEEMNQEGEGMGNKQGSAVVGMVKGLMGWLGGSGAPAAAAPATDAPGPSPTASDATGKIRTLAQLKAETEAEKPDGGDGKPGNHYYGGNSTEYIGQPKKKDDDDDAAAGGAPK